MGVEGIVSKRLGSRYRSGRSPEWLPPELRWFWALHAPSKPGTLRADSRAATLDEVKAEFEASWKQWKAWAGLEKAPNPPRSAG